jgi:hypothetical protein
MKENKKKGEKFARKQAKKGKKLVSQAEQDPDRFKIQGAIEVEHITEEQRAAKAEQFLGTIVQALKALEEGDAQNNPGYLTELEGGGFVFVHPTED